MGATDVALQAVSMMSASKANASSIIAVKAQLNSEKQVVQMIQASATNGRGAHFDITA
jgi:hypothetical protein